MFNIWISVSSRKCNNHLIIGRKSFFLFVLFYSFWICRARFVNGEPFSQVFAMTIFDPILDSISMENFQLSWNWIWLRHDVFEIKILLLSYCCVCVCVLWLSPIWICVKPTKWKTALTWRGENNRGKSVDSSFVRLEKSRNFSQHRNTRQNEWTNERMYYKGLWPKH